MMRFRFGMKTLLLVVAMAAAGLTVWTSTVRYYQRRHAQEELVLVQLSETFGPFATVQRLDQNPLAAANRVVREMRPVEWVATLHVPFPSEWFVRTTQVAIRSTPCLRNPAWTPTISTDGPPTFLPGHLVRELQRQADAQTQPCQIDWDAQTKSFEKVREFYRQLSLLTDLEVLKPGPLFGDDELALFANHAHLRILDLLPESGRASGDYHCDVGDAGLRLLETGFPSLKYLMIADDYRPNDPHSPSGNVDRSAAIQRLHRTRPELRVVYQRAGIGRIWSVPNLPGEGLKSSTSDAVVLQEMKTAEDELNRLADDQIKIESLPNPSPDLNERSPR